MKDFHLMGHDFRFIGKPATVVSLNSWKYLNGYSLIEGILSLKDSGLSPKS
jgi:hypothetical protein